MRALLWIAGGLLLWSCTHHLPNEGDVLTHARLLRMTERDGYTVVTVMSPEDTTTVTNCYLLVPRDSALPASLPTGQLIRTPLRRTAIQNTVVAALALRLNAAQSVAGICDTQYIIGEKLRREKLKNFGRGEQPDIEKMLIAQVDAWIADGYEGADYSSIRRAGIPVVTGIDYRECTPLGRAEWMKFYGRLWGVGARADSIFAEEERKYKTLSQQATRFHRHPNLLVDMREGAAWYVPGGKSYAARLYSDAGARYLFADLPQSGGVALDPEHVAQRAEKADIWVIKYGAATELTYDRLRQEDPLYSRLRAFRHHNIWACNTLCLPYYEELPFAPAALLKEWMGMLHPEECPDLRPHYFHPLP